MSPLSIDDVSHHDEDPFDVLSGILKSYNDKAGAPFEWKPVWLFARDDNGRVKGGLRGHTSWSWCFVDTLAVDEAYRQSGIGSQLLKRAEAIAQGRGCLGLYLWTTSFQAPDFYKRHGYAAFGHLPDLPPGHAATWFMKRF